MTAGLLWVSVTAVAPGELAAGGGLDELSMQQRRIEEVLSDLTDRLLSIPGVVGTAEGLCEGQPCIKVFLARKTSELLRQIPAVVEGYPVAVEETGEFRAFER